MYHVYSKLQRHRHNYLYYIGSDVSVTLSLFDSHAVSLHSRLEAMCVDPRVIIATSLNPKMVGGM